MFPTTGAGAGVGVGVGAGVWARASPIAPIATTTSPRTRTRRSVSMASPPCMLPYALEARRRYVNRPRGRRNRARSVAARRRATGAAAPRDAAGRSARAVSGNARPTRRDHRALAPGVRTLRAPEGLRDGLRPRPLLPRIHRDAASREADPDGLLVRRLARRRAGREVSPPARRAGARERVRDQGERSRDTGHPGRLHHRAAGGRAAELARSQDGDD